MYVLEPTCVPPLYVVRTSVPFLLVAEGISDNHPDGIVHVVLVPKFVPTVALDEPSEAVIVCVKFELFREMVNVTLEPMFRVP